MKRKVHYLILKDMQKYVKDFNPDDYEPSYDETDSYVIKYLEKYINAHLPIDLSIWFRVNEINQDLIYVSSFSWQICFVRDVICQLLLSYEEQLENPPMVISTYYSNSVKLPIYQIFLKNYGIEIILKHDFYDWKVSIKSDNTLDFDCTELFNLDEVILDNFCKGFPKGKVYGSYNQNHSHFTFKVLSQYDLYTFFFLLKNYLGIKRR